MGNVSARDQPYKSEGVDYGSTLSKILANVKKVHVEGLVRTKDDIVMASVEPVLKVKHFEELVIAAQLARDRLQGLGCFSDVEIQIDTSDDDVGATHDYEVTFAVQESRRIVGSVNTMVGNQEGSIMGGIRFPNILGRGEQFQVDCSQGSKKTNQFNCSFSKPIRSVEASSPLLATVTSSVYQQTSESVQSGYKDLSRAALLDVAFLSAPQVLHNLQFEALWRELSCLNRNTGFAVREHCGNTLKTAVRHILTVDDRDNPVFPAKGSLFRLNQEFAGGFGNIGFFKNELELQANVPLSASLPAFRGEEPFVLQSTFQLGMLRRLQAMEADKTMTIADHFFLGGPLNVRGFEMRGLGPSSEGNALGGLVYWATGLHLYTPLPFRHPTSSGFGDLFRTHAFVNAGNLLSDVSFADKSLNQAAEDLIQTFRLSYGVGLALKLGGIARIELNYCVPVKAEKGDQVAPGLQLGVGVNFL